LNKAILISEFPIYFYKIQNGVLLQSINTPMRSIGAAIREIINIGMNMINAMTARMQIHTIHMK
jgi:hypothetical protein